MSVAVLLAHMDDEVFLIPLLEKLKLDKQDVNIYFLTKSEGRNEKYSQDVRELESQIFLRKLIPNAKIEFLGRELDVKDLELHLNLEKTYRHLIATFKGKLNLIISPHFEGGHIDHDSAALIAKKLADNFSVELFTFSLYRAKYRKFKFFQVAKIDENQKNYLKSRISRSLVKYYLQIPFIYRSQWRTWLGIFPFLLVRVLLLRDHKILKIDKLFFNEPPNYGNLLYSRRNDGTFSNWFDNARNFLNN